MFLSLFRRDGVVLDHPFFSWTAAYQGHRRLFIQSDQKCIYFHKIFTLENYLIKFSDENNTDA